MVLSKQQLEDRPQVLEEKMKATGFDISAEISSRAEKFQVIVWARYSKLKDVQTRNRLSDRAPRALS